MIGPQLASPTAVFTTMSNYFGPDIITNAIYFIYHGKTITCYCLVVAAVLLFCHYCPKFKITYSAKLNLYIKRKSHWYSEKEKQNKAKHNLRGPHTFPLLPAKTNSPATPSWYISQMRINISCSRHILICFARKSFKLTINQRLERDSLALSGSAAVGFG